MCLPSSLGASPRSSVIGHSRNIVDSPFCSVLQFEKEVEEEVAERLPNKEDVPADFWEDEKFNVGLPGPPL